MPAHATKIEYRPAGAGTYTTLADESPTATTAALAERITGLCPRLRASPQVQPGYGAAGVAVFDQGNRQWDLGFTVERVHAGEGAAAAFLATHPLDFTTLGNLDLKITTTDGVTYLAACAVTEYTPDPYSDQSTKIRYAFTGGIYTTTAP